MSECSRTLVSVLLIGLIVCCWIRQRRYWREIHANRPSGSIRVGYKLAILTTALTLAWTAYFHSQENLSMCLGIILTTMFFCLKITFSPGMLALTLAVCTLRLHTTSEFPFLEVWTGITTALMWRLPEDVRMVYSALSFVWVMASFLSAPASAASEGDSVAESLADSFSSTHGV